MEEHELAAHGLRLRERIIKGDYTYEVQTSLYHIETGELVAAYSVTTRRSWGEQTLSTSTQFIQRNHLTFEQIEAVTRWLHDCTHSFAARWRLTSFTTMVLAEVRQ